MDIAINPLLLEAFGKAANGIESIVQDFVSSKMDISRSDSLETRLTPSIPKFTQESAKAMDDALKIVIMGTLKALKKIPEENRSWNTVLGAMMQNPLVKLKAGAHIVDKEDRFDNSNINVFRFDGSPERAVVQKVQDWFKRLISDDNVLHSTSIDIDVLANLVAATGAAVEAGSLIYQHTYHQRTMVDICVLRFPDFDEPYLQLYHIKLIAWKMSERVLVVQGDDNGITGEYHSRKFEPREGVIDQINPDLKKKTIKDAEDLLSG